MDLRQLPPPPSLHVPKSSLPPPALCALESISGGYVTGPDNNLLGAACSSSVPLFVTSSTVVVETSPLLSGPFRC